MPRTVTASTMRRINRSAILDIIRRNSPISRSAIARKLGLSLPTVMRVMEDLMEEDLVRLQGTIESTGRPGRPKPLIEFNADAYAIIGVDLGGTKMFGTIADLGGKVQDEIYINHNEEGPSDAFERLVQLIRSLAESPRAEGQRLRGIGVGAPGLTTVPEGIVSWAPSLQWREFPLQDALAERFDVPVFVENDVNLAALGEWGFGAGRGTQSLVTIAIGTGIGAGIVIDGALHRGHHQAAGEIGYLLPDLEHLGRHYEGFGALESLASGTGIAERARRIAPADVGSRDELTAEDVFCAARDGVPWAQRVVDETVDYLSLAIANVQSLFDPEVIVLGGGVAQSADLLIQPILERLNGATLVPPNLVPSELGRRAAVMGAIMMVLNATTDRISVRRWE